MAPQKIDLFVVNWLNVAQKQTNKKCTNNEIKYWSNVRYQVFEQVVLDNK